MTPISQQAARKMLETLIYLRDEFDRHRVIDAINMAHVYGAIAVAEFDMDLNERARILFEDHEKETA